MGIFSFLKKKKHLNELNPESDWIVKMDSSTIKATDYEENDTSLELEEITQIVLETNNSGPWGTDVWWKIYGKDISISVPNGATGETEMMEAFQAFPNFNNEEFINAMQSTENAEFTCWEKQ